jgi:hypothetical protein
VATETPSVLTNVKTPTKSITAAASARKDLLCSNMFASYHLGPSFFLFFSFWVVMMGISIMA